MKFPRNARIFRGQLDAAPFAAVLFLLARNIVDSKHGRAFIAIRESELAARGMGVNLAHYKTTAFALGAFYAGISGGLFAGIIRGGARRRADPALDRRY